MILARAPAVRPLASAGSLPEALEDVTQAGRVAREYLGRVQTECAPAGGGRGRPRAGGRLHEAVDRLVRFLFASASAHFMSASRA